MKTNLSIQIPRSLKPGGRLINPEIYVVPDQNSVTRQEMIYTPSICARCEKLYIPGYLTDWKALGFCTSECYLSEMLTIGRKPETISPAHKHVR